MQSEEKKKMMRHSDSVRARASSSSAVPNGHDSASRRLPGENHFRLVVMGAAGVGKSSIVSRFLHNEFNDRYQATVEELYRGEYEVDGMLLTLDILDTAGSYQFPAMRRLAIANGDAFVLVYAMDDEASFEEVRAIRQQILEDRRSRRTSSSSWSTDSTSDEKQRQLSGDGSEVIDDDEVDDGFADGERWTPPIVVVANKVEEGRSRAVNQQTAETLVTIDWANGYVETSARDNRDVDTIFKELLVQANVPFNMSPAIRRRRESMPASMGSSSGGSGGRKASTVGAGGRRNTCKIS